MKNTILIFAIFISSLFSYGIDTLNVKHKITDVTVFFDGAEVTRNIKLNLVQGKYLIIIDKLPAEINPESIRVNNKGKGKISSVAHKLKYPKPHNQIKKNYENKILEKEIKIKDIRNQINVFNMEEELLIDNSNFSKQKSGVSITEIKEAAEFYRFKLNEIKKAKLNLSIRISEIEKEILSLYKDLNRKLSENNKVYSEVSFILECKTALKSNFSLNYVIASAGWEPFYDFRVSSINAPLNIVYKAHIYQSSGEDWNNVNLVLSTNQASLSNLKPDLDTWFIDRKRTRPKKPIKEGTSSLIGRVFDAETGEPLPFANISIEQNGQILTGAASDFDGQYIIKPINTGHYKITASYIGYESIVKNNMVFRDQDVKVQDFHLKAGEKLACLEVRSYKKPRLSQTVSKMSVAASEVRGLVSFNSRKKRRKEHKIEFIEGYEISDNITSLEYKIPIPYNIPSDGNDYQVKVKEVKLPVDYIYQAVPKLDPDAFLVADISQWSKLELLAGDINVYYKGTYTGKTEVDLNHFKDTLSISLSRDPNLMVKRTLIKEKSKRQLIGKTVKETVNWNITVRNNKKESVKLLVEDQLPKSENKLIEIETLDISNGILDQRTGKIIWELELKANETKELSLKYAIKYPNYLNIIVD